MPVQVVGGFEDTFQSYRVFGALTAVPSVTSLDCSLTLATLCLS